MDEIKAQDDMEGWCYNERTTYTLSILNTDAWLTGCPLCGDNCWEKVTPESKKEADEYFQKKPLTFQ